MLAIFNRNTASVPVPNHPNLRVPGEVSALDDKSLDDFFATQYPKKVTIRLPPHLLLHSALDSDSPPRRFAIRQDIFCILHGQIENVNTLLPSFNGKVGLDHTCILIEAYKSTVRHGKASQQWLHLVQQLKGKFCVTIFDNKTKNMFAATGCDDTMGLGFFWGTDVDGNLVLATTREFVNKGCGSVYGPFPKGCYIMSPAGLRKFQEPENELEFQQTLNEFGCLSLSVRE